MEQPTEFPTTPAGVVAGANGLLTRLDETLWAAKDASQIVDTVAELETVRAHLAALEASVLAEIGARGIAKQELAWGSTAEWFTHTGRHHPPRGAPDGAAGARSWSVSGPRRTPPWRPGGSPRSRPR